MKDIQQKNEQRPSIEKSKVYAVAERRMRSGKKFVFGGFVVAIIGIVGYCLVCLSVGANPGLGAFLLQNPEKLVVPTLATIGLGTLLWLIGSYMYLNGAMDSDPDGPDLFF